MLLYKIIRLENNLKKKKIEKKESWKIIFKMYYYINKSIITLTNQQKNRLNNKLDCVVSLPMLSSTERPLSPTRYLSMS